MYPYKFIFSNEINQETIIKDKLLCGLIMDKQNRPIKDAIVRLENYDDNNSRVYIITDKDGEFVYGPLKNAENINIKVWVEDIEPKKYLINISESV